MVQTQGVGELRFMKYFWQVLIEGVPGRVSLFFGGRGRCELL